MYAADAQRTPRIHIHILVPIPVQLVIVGVCYFASVTSCICCYFRNVR